MYVNNMIVKSSEEELHDQYLTHVFQRAQQYNMRLNQGNCTFEVIGGKLLVSNLNERAI